MLAEQDEVSRRHDQLHARYVQYMETRVQRRTAAEQEAMDEVDDKQRRSGRPWPNQEERFMARRDAGFEARERFEIYEPLLPFADWEEAGAPERYQADTPTARVEGLLKRFGLPAG